MKIIGFTGPAGCGKTEAADFLQQQFGFAKKAFADPLKRMVAALLDITPEELEQKCQDRSFKEGEIAGLGKSPRQLLQTLGTEWGRDQVHPDIWVMVLQLHAFGTYWQPDVPGIAIHDVRFENEANWIRMHDGLIVHIEREGIEEVAAHASEQGVQRWASDAVISNDGDIFQLHNRLFHLVTDKGIAA